MFYGWKITLLGSAGNFLLQGSTIYIMNAFIEPLNALYGWTRADISTIMFFAALFGAFSMPVFSSLALRIPLRLIMSAGALFGGLCATGMGITDNLYVFGLLFILTWISGQAFGGVSANILINKWFSRFQGRAFGICNIGNSLAGAVLPFLLMISIQYTNVKLTWILYGIIILCFVPVCLFLIVEKPSDMGLHADNLANGKKEIRSEVFIPLKTVLQYPEIYYIGFTFGFMLMSSSSVLSQLKLRFTDVGIESFTAMALMCLTAFFCAIAKYLWGWLCDKICPVLVTRILVLFHIGALFLLFIPANLAVILIFTVCFGLAAGGSWAVMPSITAYLFGKERFICTYRAVSPFVILKALGFLIVGFSYSFFGSYDAAYLIFIVILSCCFLLTLLLKPLTTQNTLTVA